MCTVAWGNSENGLWLCFNRDEQRTRSLADAPRLHTGPNGPVAYARDPDGGGTWLAVSIKGFAVGLLNAYPGESVSIPPGRRSRGQLVRALAEGPSAPESRRRLAGEDLSAYAPFYLLLCEPQAVDLFFWDGSGLRTPTAADCFWTTSSFDPEDIVARRHDWWRRQSADGRMDGEHAADLLRQTDPGNPACAPTMDREDARTVSQISLILGPSGFTYVYRAREPHGPGYGNPVVLRWPS